jgi:thiamine-phosphate pyrophosphorylase
MPRRPLGKLYPITPSGNRERILQFANQCLSGGASVIQVREKGMTDRLLHQTLLEIKKLCRCFEALLIVNDRVDLALASQADGVHLGQDDLPVEAARRLLGPQALIGLSTHSRAQFEDAQSRPIDYLAIGPVFSSATKPGAAPEIGLQAFREMASASRFPVVAIGGIDLHRARSLWAAGADSVAVISDLSAHPHPAQRVEEYLHAAQEIES